MLDDCEQSPVLSHERLLPLQVVPFVNDALIKDLLMAWTRSKTSGLLMTTSPVGVTVILSGVIFKGISIDLTALQKADNQAIARRDH